MDSLGMNALWIASIGFAIVFLVLIAVGAVTIVINRHKPTVAKALAAEAQLAQLSQRLRDLEFEISEKRAILTEVDKKSSEVAWLEERLSTLRAEIATLEPRRAEIIEVQDELDRVTSQLGDSVREREVVRAELEAMRSQLEEARRLASEIENLERRAAELRKIVEDLQEERDAAAQARRELARLREEIAELHETKARLASVVDAHLERKTQASDELTALQAQCADAKAILLGLASEIGEAEKVRDELARMRADIAQLTERRADLLAKNAELEARIEAMGGQGPGAAPDKLEDLMTMPAVLSDLMRPSRAERETEDACLRRAQTWIGKSGLRYPERTIRAFHTALKVAQEAPMTVLSGISGTGKTQLPRIYAQAMGIGFLPMPVQPRWDSPQDLLGFYNFIEKKYKATELARAMWQLDGHGKSDDANLLKDRLLLVLLDEMNLARVEYYFSEFLSRLELRPRPSEAGDPEKRRSAEIVIDIPGEPPQRIFPGHNLLFVGTMNEDESTQALSDKVLDRGNMLRFPAPRRLEPAVFDAGALEVVPPLSRKVWDGWRKDPSYLRDPDLARDIVGLFSDRMKTLGRPFGHRVGQAMLAYAANYPAHDGQAEASLNTSMADQVEMRLLPKLRGLELDQARPELERFAVEVRDRLGDADLADAINRSLEESEAGAGRFVWSGLAR